jgi:SAM-dependent methyltransferase
MTGITYSPAYDSPDLRGSEEIRPWDILDIIQRFWKPGTTVLDVGCGTCAKTAWMAPKSKEFIALDPSPKMREAAQERLRSVGGRTQVLDGTAGAIPLPAASVSYLACVMVPHDIDEFARVLSEGSLCVLEMLGELDKRALKDAFPPDTNGQRGQMTELAYPGRQARVKSQLSEHFDFILFSEGWWNSYFTRFQLELLLSQTNTVRGFSTEADREVLDRFEESHREHEGIPLVNHRYLFVARRR